MGGGGVGVGAVEVTARHVALRVALAIVGHAGLAVVGAALCDAEVAAVPIALEGEAGIVALAVASVVRNAVLGATWVGARVGARVGLGLGLGF